MGDIPPTPAHPFAPPTERGEIVRPPPRSSWPTVIGTISIIIGVLGALAGLWGAAAPFVIHSFAGKLHNQTFPGMETADAWRVWTALLALVAVGLAVLLLVAGIGLVRRRRPAARTATVWAILRMVLVVVQAGVSYQLAQQQFAEMQRDPNLRAMAAGFSGIVGTFTVVAILLWGWALPLFLLIWFHRRTIKTEVSTWP